MASRNHVCGGTLPQWVSWAQGEGMGGILEQPADEDTKPDPNERAPAHDRLYFGCSGLCVYEQAAVHNPPLTIHLLTDGP